MSTQRAFEDDVRFPESRPDWWRYPNAGAATPETTVLDRLLEATLPANRLTLTVEETAKIVGIGRTAAYDAVRRGDLPSRRINDRIAIPVPALLDWLGIDCRTSWAG